MNSNDVGLASVNWEHGMLLTPDHFVRQERYFDSALLWILRYATNSYGLVGGGPRLPETERGAVRYDPVVVVDEDNEAVSISVTQCRSLTPAGCIIDIDPEHPVHRRFPKADLEGVAGSGVYIVCAPHEKEVVDGPLDEFNPQMKTERRPNYRISLQIRADEVGYSTSVARLRRPKYASGYEKDPEFIPACTSMASYSELAGAWRKIVDEVTLVAGRYTELHRAMQEFLVLFKERDIDTDLDVETMTFVSRMVVALQNCVYEILDPVQAPQKFFGQLNRFFHSAAVYLDLSPPTQQYFAMLKETGETEFTPLLEQQKRVLQTTRKWEIHEDLGDEVRAALQSLGSLRRLERALEGKYLDFRISPSLEAMNFVFDRGGKALYKLAAKPSRIQGFADELTMTFSQLDLEGRDKYRLILAGEKNAALEKGDKITVELRLNEGSGFRRQPIILSAEPNLPEQRNFELDFDAPDVPIITDLRVSLQARHPVRTALLFVRHRLHSSRLERGAQPLQRQGPPREEALPSRDEGSDDRRRISGEPSLRERERVRDAPLTPARDRSSDVPPENKEPAPWEHTKRGEEPREPSGPPPRRRRLE